MKTFNQWLDEEQGRAARVAELFRISSQAVSQWRTAGVPRRYILPVHALTAKQVPLETLIEKPRAVA